MSMYHRNSYLLDAIYPAYTRRQKYGIACIWKVFRYGPETTLILQGTLIIKLEIGVSARGESRATHHTVQLYTTALLK